MSCFVFFLKLKLPVIAMILANRDVTFSTLGVMYALSNELVFVITLQPYRSTYNHRGKKYRGGIPINHCVTF